MTATNYTQTMRAVREQGHARGIASDLSAVTRRLDILDRQAEFRARHAPAIALMILDHDAARRALGTARVKKDERYAFWESEVAILGREVDERIRKYLQTVPDAKFLTSTPTAWAKATLRQAKRDADAAEQRRAARAARGTTKVAGKCRKCGRQSPSLSLPARLCAPCATGEPRHPPAKGKLAGRAGRCSVCHKAKDYITTSGLCQDCVYVVYPRLRR